ncbi:Short-chain dehydrogenase reductase 2a-like protein [Drosera capensis]
MSRLSPLLLKRLEGKIALITGGASGIGKATASKFIQNGAKVLIADIQEKLGQDAAHELGPNASFVQCDVTKESDVSNSVDLAMSKHGRLDIMYNNAGVAYRTSNRIIDLDLDRFDSVMAINVRGVVAGIKHAARVMIPRHTGCILCTASVTGVLGGMAPHTYSVSKSAVIGVVRSAAAELRQHGIRINAISPFVIPTPMVMNELRLVYAADEDENIFAKVKDIGELEGANCEADDIANAAVYLASDEAKYVSGHNLVVDGGFTVSKSLDLPPPG